MEMYKYPDPRGGEIIFQRIFFDRLVIYIEHNQLKIKYLPHFDLNLYKIHKQLNKHSQICECHPTFGLENINANNLPSKWDELIKFIRPNDIWSVLFGYLIIGTYPKFANEVYEYHPEYKCFKPLKEEIKKLNISMNSFNLPLITIKYSEDDVFNAIINKIDYMNELVMNPLFFELNTLIDINKYLEKFGIVHSIELNELYPNKIIGGGKWT